MSGGAPLPSSHVDLHNVNKVQFEVFKEKQIKDYAVCMVHVAKSFEHGRPVRGGINDLRMGSTDFEWKCETCHQRHPHCPGHMGYIELAEPMYHIGHYANVFLILRSVCKACGGLLIPEEELAKLKPLRGLHRLRMAAKLAKNRCSLPSALGLQKLKYAADVKTEYGMENSEADLLIGARAPLSGEKGCGAIQPKLSRLKGVYPGLGIRVVTQDQEMLWSAQVVRQVLDNISDADATWLGFNPVFCHPRDLILSVLPVPPPAVRPAVSFGSNRSDDELTHQLLSIIKRNNELFREKESGLQASTERIREMLQENIAAYFQNNSTYYKPVKVTDTKALKSLFERLKGKYGRLRGNLMGKRVDFSSRTVITGDPNIDVDEIGIPYSIAMTLTFPEVVSPINKKRLTEFVRRSVYPSANYVRHVNGSITKLALRKDRTQMTLNVGDVVERHVVNGDVVLFNRQPTLHRMSMMGHRVRVLNYNTFRLNLSCTTPYNADFDGDEMNMHVPQSLLTKAELIELMMVPKNYVSPNKSAPCMGIVQDNLLGSYRLTDKEVFLDKYFVQCVATCLGRWSLPIPAILMPRPLWTGKQIFSMALPEVNHPSSDLPNYTNSSHIKPPFPHNDSAVLIRRGELLCGAIKKSVVGAAPGSLVHVIFNEKGSDEVTRFLNGVQRISTYFLLHHSFSVGVQDTVAESETLFQMNDVLQETRKSVEKFGAAANNRTLQRKAGMTLLQSFEADVNSALNRCREEAAKKALRNVGRTNSFKVMIEAGSKGTDLNICQIAVFVGQQNVNGARIPFGFQRRTLPHFNLDDYGETSRGMVTRGYVEGLKPHEFFFHTMAGREGLIDTAVKTSDTGYLQRKLIKSLEDSHAAYDGTVRNANQELIQFMYGEDGLDGARIEGNQAFPLTFMSNHDMIQMYRYEYGEDGAFSSNVGGAYMRPNIRRSLRADPENAKILQGEFDQLVQDRKEVRELLQFDDKTKLNLPVNIVRLIQNACRAMGEQSQLSNLHPITIIDKVKKLQEDLHQLFPSYQKDFQKPSQNSLSHERIEYALTLFNIHLRHLLASKRILREYKLNDKAFNFLLSEIRTKYMQSLIHPGEMVGTIAAQSCGEPATQMTLNTFHNAGISSKNVTLGVPRLLELLNVSRNQRHCSMLIWMAPGWEVKRKTQHAQHMVEHCTLEDLTCRLQIIYDPDPKITCVEMDQETLSLQWEVMEEEDAMERMRMIQEGSPWVVRLELNSDMWDDKMLSVREVKEALRRVLQDKFLVDSFQYTTTQVSGSNVPGEKVQERHSIIRLRALKHEVESSISSLKSTIPTLLSNVHLRGIPGVKKALLKEIQIYPLDPLTGGVRPVKVCAIDTDGSALSEAFQGVLDENGNNIIDFSKTTCNNIPEIHSILGIEAARIKLLTELREAYLAYGLNINYRHYTMLVDIMTQRGYLMAVSRVGINRSDLCGPLMRCSFEETVKILMDASSFGECDPVRGVSSHIILGLRPCLGSGMMKLIMNVSQLQHAVSQEMAVAPGTEINIYHGPESVFPESLTYEDHRRRGWKRGGGEISSTPTFYTPLANDVSAFFEDHGYAYPNSKSSRQPLSHLSGRKSHLSSSIHGIGKVNEGMGSSLTRGVGGGESSLTTGSGMSEGAGSSDFTVTSMDHHNYWRHTTDSHRESLGEERGAEERFSFSTLLRPTSTSHEEPVLASPIRYSALYPTGVPPHMNRKEGGEINGEGWLDELIHDGYEDSFKKTSKGTPSGLLSHDLEVYRSTSGIYSSASLGGGKGGATSYASMPMPFSELPQSVQQYASTIYEGGEESSIAHLTDLEDEGKATKMNLSSKSIEEDYIPVDFL